MRKLLFWILPLALLAACTQTLPEDVKETAAPEPVAKQQESALIPGSMIIQVSEDLAAQLASGALQTKSSELNAVFNGLGVTHIERVYPEAGEFEPRHRKAGLHRWFFVNYDQTELPATKAVQDFTSVDGVVYAAPERRIESNDYFNDPYASKQWSLFNDGSLGDVFTPGCDINVEPVWENYTAGSPDVIVSVHDKGIQLDHPDLAANMIPAGENGSRCFISGYDETTIYPENHGTHVAGIIAAVSNNGIGISGIAGGKDGHGVRIMAIQMMMQDPNDKTKTLGGNDYNSYVWAADHGAIISQNSWGYVYNSEEDAMNSYPSHIFPALDYFIDNAGCDLDGNQRKDSPMKGGVIIFAAGNERWRMAWPAAYERVIAVGAVGSAANRSYYSNHGDWVDICAPGGDENQNVGVYSTITGGEYGYMQGTSMACPHVSGVAALIASYFGGPGFTNKMLIARLLGGASEKKAPVGGEIGPMVDALGSFTWDKTTPPEPASGLSASVASNSITLSWKVTSDPDDGKAYGYVVLLATNAAVLKDIKPTSIPSTVKSVNVTVGKLAVGDDISATLSELEFDTKYYATVIAYDYADNYSAQSPVKEVTTAKNNPPVITTTYTGDYKVKPFDKLIVDYSISDPDGHSVTVEVTPGSTAFVGVLSGSTVRAVITGKNAPHGKYTATIVAKDSYGATSEYSIPYEILENHPPKLLASISDQQFGQVGAKQSFDLSKYFQDEDGETLSYSISMTEQGVAELSATGNSLSLSTKGYGLTTATVTAADACGASVSFSFRILVRDETRPVDLYPNPVVNTLNIRLGTAGQVNVSITNKVGATVWTGSATAGPFDPMAADLSALPGGTYYVRVENGGVSEVYTIAKQ